MGPNKPTKETYMVDTYFPEMDPCQKHLFLEATRLGGSRLAHGPAETMPAPNHPIVVQPEYHSASDAYSEEFGLHLPHGAFA